MDDLSTDNSSDIVKGIINDDERFLLVNNKQKLQAGGNIYHGIEKLSPTDDDIIVTVDGDDWLENENVLTKLNFIYNKEECWMTYGSYKEFPSNQIGKFAKPLVKEIQDGNLYRQSEWFYSHLRTFKYHIYKKINVEDLKDNEGNFYKMAGDLSWMFPLLEMSGKRVKYISDILYVYNLDNPLNDHKLDHKLQLNSETEIRNKKKYGNL
mgnify:CR=1 FL=1